MTTLRAWSALLAMFIFSGLVAQTLQWAQATGASSQEVWEDVVIDGTGAVITVGTLVTGGTPVDLDPGPGVFNVQSIASSYDIFFRKLDANGNFQWGGSFGGNSSDGGLSVAVDGSDNVFLSGSIGTADLDPGPGVFTVTASNGGFDAFVVKLSPAGVFQWGRIFGGAATDAATAVAVDNEGNVWTTGYLGNGGDLDPGAGTFNAAGNGLQDIFISKLDPNGLFSWGGCIGGSNNDLGHGICATIGGDVVVCGEFRNTADFDPGAGVMSRTSAGGTDMFVLRLNGLGTVQWVQPFGGNGFETARSVAVDPAGNLAFTGEVNSNIDMDPGPGTAMLAGGTGFESSFAARLTGTGGYLWSYLFGGFINKGNSVALDGQGDLYATGIFGGTMDMDPGPGITNLTAATGSDAYVARYTAGGALSWCFKLDASTGSMQAKSITVAPDARVAVTGAFPGTMDMDPSTGTSSITAAGFTDAFTGIYVQTTPCANLAVQVKLVLEGPWKAADQLMVDSLRVRGMLPLSEPYTAMGLPPAVPSVTTAPVLALAGPDAIVDWVLLELRDLAVPGQVVERRAALLQRDGDVVAIDGVSAVTFCAPAGDYHIAARHRNHLGVMTAGHLSLSGSPSVIDLTTAATAVFGTEARHDMNGMMVLWPGNVVPNTVVSYTGSGNDRDPILVAVGSTTPTNVVDGYALADVDLDGSTKYTGSGNDRDRVLLTVGGSTPNNTRPQQLP